MLGWKGRASISSNRVNQSYKLWPRMRERWASCARANDLCNLWKNMLLKNRAFFSNELNVIGHSRMAYFSAPTQIWYQIIFKRNIYWTTTQGADFFYYEWGRGKIVLNLIQPEKKTSWEQFSDFLIMKFLVQMGSAFDSYVLIFH